MIMCTCVLVMHIMGQQDCIGVCTMYNEHYYHRVAMDFRAMPADENLWHGHYQASLDMAKQKVKTEPNR